MSSSILHAMNGHIIRHWRGKYPVFVTILILLLCLRVMIGLIPFISNSVLSLAIVIASLLIFIWQIVGTWRCIEWHLRATGETMVYWTGWSSMFIVTVLTFLHAADLLIPPSPKITLESLRKSPLPLLSEDGTRIYLKGEINYDLNDDLLTLVKQNEQISTVVLESVGGRIYAARALAFSIEKNNLNTHVDKECNSACTIAFMAGKTRTLRKAGRIGFHQYQFSKPHPLRVNQAGDEQDKDRLYFAKQGIKKDFLARVYESGHEDIWQPDRQVLLESGVITQD